MTESAQDSDPPSQLPVPPTRSETAPSLTLSSSEENVREGSRRILEKFLQQELLKRQQEGVAKAETRRQDDEHKVSSGRGASQSSVEFQFATSVQRSQQCQFTAIRAEHENVTTKTGSDLGVSSSVGLPNRQASVEAKSSQSTCSSYDGPRRGTAADLDSQRQTTSAAAAGSLSSSSSSVEGKDARAKIAMDNKRKKSLLRRAKERLERTLSLRCRRAEEKMEKKKKRVKTSLNSFPAARGKRRWVKSSPENESPTAAPIQRSNSEESTPEAERHFHVQFSQMNVSSCPKGSDGSKNGKHTRTRRQVALKESTNGGAIKKMPDFLTPPDSGFRSAKKRPKRAIADNAQEDFRRPASSIVSDALSSGMKLLKKHTTSDSRCSPTRWLKRKVADRRQKPHEGLEKPGGASGSFSLADAGNGLELLAKSNHTPFPNSTGILHRVSGEYDERLKQLDAGAEGTTANVVNIQIEPATTSSSEPQSSLSPPWSIGEKSQPDSAGFAGSSGFVGQEARGQQSAESSQSSQDRRSSDEMEEKYALIAQRLAELGDAFLSNQWTQLTAQSAAADGEGETELQAAAPRPNFDRLTSIEKEVVEFITTCDQTMQSGEAQFQKGIVLELVRSGNAQQFGRILNSVTEPNPVDYGVMSWARLAVMFHLTTAAVRMVGAGTSAARRLVDYCCDYVTFTFSGWIIGQGGWSSVVEDQSSGEDEKARNKDL